MKLSNAVIGVPLEVNGMEPRCRRRVSGRFRQEREMVSTGSSERFVMHMAR
ncbi:hypothetical protein [Bradyrhizobium sp. SRS-191]|uniref:hypothetical protein n=1 Tax=Bradyrhizobium sp. SRS-191 TaxID=2962606 RepID=UPI00211F0DAC|nr:hypothetical protein [Bradyrhizobium sp. SRS-191]